MPLQFSDTLRNARINQFETVLSNPKLRLMSGALPANCAAADAGTLLCEMTLPVDYLTAASGGIKTKVGTWSGVGDAGAGAGTNVGYFRMKTGTTTHCQGNVTTSGLGGAMTIDDLNIIAGQPVTITAFSLTDGNP